MQSIRIQRVRELLKRAIGEAIRREISVERAGLISVNDVGVAGDLKSATVFISLVGTPAQQKTGQALLRQHARRIQSLVARSVVLKYTPRLRFVLDDSIVRGNRVLEVIEEIERELPAT
jgi:ribosome-binding factor A